MTLWAELLTGRDHYLFTGLGYLALSALLLFNFS